MKLFAKPRRGRPKKKPKLVKDILRDAYIQELQKDPELKREISLREAGHAELLERDRELETQKRQIKRFVTSEAFKKIQTDPELAEQFIESQVEDILSEGKPSKGRRKGEPEYYETGSSISQALEEVQSLSELREKLQELGMIEGGGKGFFKSMSMKDLLEALPYIATIMGKGEGVPSAVKTYVVKVDGRDQELTESQYRKFLQEGRLAPIAALESPKSKEPEEEIEEGIHPMTAESKEVPELPEFLQGINFEVVGTWMEQEPEDFVINLKSEVDSEVQESRLVWGLLTNITFDRVIEIITPYKEHPEVGSLVQRVLTDEGKAWLSRVIELVQEVS